VKPAEAPRRQSDVELAQRAASGDRQAQRELLAFQRGPIHRTLFRILGSNRDMEDVLQDTLLEVFRSLDRFRGDSTLTRYCCTIATRVAWAYLDRRRPTHALDLVPEPISDDPDVHQQALSREAARRLYAALDRLDPKLRIAFALAVVDQRPLAEVAALVDASVVAVKTRVWRARRELTRRAKRDDLLATYLVDLAEEVS
jgi:RNA polymerase sigma-70 factor (ECF subfamily)